MGCQRAEIHFYDQDKCAVFLESEFSGDEEIAAELTLFASFCIRTLASFGVCQESDALAGILSLPPRFSAILHNQSAEGFSLVPYQGHAGRYSFQASLKGNADQTQFYFNPIGFGWLGKGLGYYGPVAALALARKLVERRAEDRMYGTILVLTACVCGEMHRCRQITMTNQRELAHYAVDMAIRTATEKRDASLSEGHEPVDQVQDEAEEHEPVEQAQEAEEHAHVEQAHDEAEMRRQQEAVSRQRAAQQDLPTSKSDTESGRAVRQQLLWWTPLWVPFLLLILWRAGSRSTNGEAAAKHDQATVPASNGRENLSAALISPGTDYQAQTAMKPSPAAGTTPAATSSSSQASSSAPEANSQRPTVSPQVEVADATVSQPAHLSAAPLVAPFNAAQAHEAQFAWAQRYRTFSEIQNSIGMNLILIPPGQYWMGSPETADEVVKIFPYAKRDWLLGECPVHRVTISRPFYLGKYEVTQGQFRKFVRSTGYRTDALKDGLGPDQRENSPVVNVNYNDATAFCEWLSRKESRTYRLPTEAEWEYACRAGTDSRYYNGDDPKGLTQIAKIGDDRWDKDRYLWDGTALQARFAGRVGRFQPNNFGLYDMIGNAAEWCSDWFSGDYYSMSPDFDPTGPSSGSFRVRRGGSGGSGTVACRAAYRGRGVPAQGRSDLGFRVALSCRD